MKKILLLLICILSILNVSAQWQSVNNGLDGGNITVVAIDSATNYIYAGTNGGGVFLSTDTGTSWTAVNEGLTNLTVISIAVTDTNIYVGTTAGGFFISNDKGSTWNEKNTGLPNSAINTISINGSYLFAGTKGDGIFISYDNGSNWYPRNSGLLDLTVNSVVGEGPTVAAGTSAGVFISINYGESWLSFSNGLPVFVRVTSLYGFNGGILAGTIMDGVFLSLNAGDWTAVNTGLTNLSVNSFTANGDSILASTDEGGVYFTTDTGSSWTPLNDGILSTPVNSLAISGSNLYAGTQSHGVYKSIDSGNSWMTSNSGIYNINIKSITRSGSNIFIGTSNGVYKSTDRGNSWTEVNNGLPFPSENAISSMAVSGNNIFAGTYGDGGVYRSTDSGSNWTVVNNGLEDTIVTSIVINGNNIFAGTSNGVYRSTDNGNNWTPARNGLPEGFYVNTLAISENDFYAGNYPDGMYFSADSGTNWTAKNNGLSGYSISIQSLAINGEDVFAGTQGGLIKSTDKGNNWLTLDNGLPEKGYIRSLTTNGDDIFAGNYAFGVFLSTDGGGAWSPQNTGLLSTRVSTMAIIDDEIYAGTSHGLWKRSLSDIYSLNVSSDSAVMGAQENSIVTFDVSSNTNWMVSCSEPWLTASPDSSSGDTTITLTASANPDNSSRAAVVTVSGPNVESREIYVTQNGLSTDIHEWDDFSIQIYPNPAKDYITVSIANFPEMADLTLRIFNLIGVKVIETKLNQPSYHLDLSSLTAKGIYFLQLHDKKNTIKMEKKIVLQ